MIRPDQTKPVDTRPYIQWATAQIRQMLEETPAVCLFLLEQTDNAPQSCLADDLSQFLDRVTLDHQGSAIEALAELLPWVDCQALAAWLVDQRPQHKGRLIAICRHRIAAAYLELSRQRFGVRAFIHQHNHLELSVELVGLAISNHIEGALLESRGPLAGLDACLTMLGAMLTPDGHSLAPVGVTVMDELFRSLVDEYSGNDLPIQKARH